tara:strand:- start:158 stop:496 length:339 start_codon:yes stop_codon:yes gene_type:complete
MIKMEFNKSQLLIMGTISSAVLGFPNINKIFTEEVIKIVMENPSQIMIFLVSIIKILLVIGSVAWLFQLIKNIEITYRTKSDNVFQNYLLKLAVTGILTFFGSLLLKNFIGF